MQPEPSFDKEKSVQDGKAPAQNTAPSGGVTAMFGTLSIPGDGATHGQPPSEAFDPLLDLLRSSPPVPIQPPAAAPQTPSTPPQAPAPPPASFAPPPAAPAVTSSGAGFTQLLRALSADQLNAPPSVAPAPVRVEPVTAAPPVNLAQPPIRSNTSVTQLLRTLDEPLRPPAATPPPTVAREDVFSPAPVETHAEAVTRSSAPQESPAVEVSAAGAPASTEPSSFTQLFQAVSPAAAPVVAATPAPPQPASPQPVVGGAFRQETVAAAATPQSEGSFTQLFQALDSPPPIPLKPAETLAPVTPAVVVQPVETAAPAPLAKAPEPPAAAAPVAQDAGSFTQMFQSLSPQASIPSTPPAATMSAAAGSVTQMLSAVPEPSVPEPAPETVLDDLGEQVAEPAWEPVPPVSPEPVAVAPVAPIAASAAAAAPPVPGAFTQMLNATDLSKLRSAQLQSVLPAPVVPAAFTPPPSQPSVINPTPQSAPQAGPGSFTQLFSAENFQSPATSSQQGAAMPSASPFAPPSPPQSQAAPGSGSFTQLFKALDTPAPPPLAAGASGTPAMGGFTQMFKSLDSTPGSPQAMPQAPPAPTPSAPLPMANDFTAPGMGKAYEPVSSSGGLGASQMFSSYAPPQPAAAPPVVSTGAVDFGYSAPVAPPAPATPVPKQGGAGLTQLLQTLQTPSQSSAPFPTRMPEPAASSGSIFTQTYQGLNAAGSPSAFPQMPTPAMPAANSFPMPAQPPAPNTTPAGASSGPSEFTRILSASALREASLRGGGASAAPVAPTAPAGGGSPGMPMPSVSWSAPSMPSMPSIPSASSSSVPGMSAPGMPSVSTPSISMPSLSMPSMPQPAAPAPPAAGAGAQPNKLLLILGVVIFLLVVAIIVMFFVMKK